MIRRVILIVSSTWCQRDFDRFGVKILQESGFIVETWDCTPILRPFFWKKAVLKKSNEFSGLKVFFNQTELEKRLQLLSGRTDFCFIMTGLLENTEFVFDSILKGPVKSGLVFFGSTPGPTLYFRMAKMLRSDSLSQIMHKAGSFLKRKKKRLETKSSVLHSGQKIDGVDFWFLAGKKAVEYYSHYPSGPNTKYIDQSCPQYLGKVDQEGL